MATISKFVPVDMENILDVTFNRDNMYKFLNEGDPEARISNARPIKATELSEEDKFILNKKREHRTDQEISDYLKKEYGLHYVSKTIGTRWSRLRKKIAAHRDMELDAGTTKWTPKENVHLIEAVIRAKAAVKKLISEAGAKTWHIVVKELHECDRSLVFSSRASQEQYEKIRDGQISLYRQIDSGLQSQAKLACENFEQAMKERYDIQEKADRDIKIAIFAHQEEEDIASTASNDDAAVAETQYSGLPAWIDKSTSQDKNVNRAYEELKSRDLPPVHFMKRHELVAELTTRGFQSGHIVGNLRVIVRKARNGEMDMPKSTIPLMKVSAFMNMLREKKVREVDDDEEEDDKDDD